MKFADNLKRLRKNKNISQEELAEKVGVSRQSVSKWETSEAYPEMNNILELCKIFHCNIGELVNDNMIDLDSLDDDVKMSIVKLKKEKQKQMKGISKVLSLIGKITAIVLRVFLGFIIAAMIGLPIAVKFIDVEDGKLVSKNNVIQLVEHEKTTDIRIGNSVIVANFGEKEIENIIPAIEHYSETGVLVLIEVGLAVLCAFIIVLVKSLGHLEKLFNNIHEGDTPFTLENVEHIKKMSYLMIACIFLSGIGEVILDIPFRNQIDIDFNMVNIVEILFVYSMSLIFEYGYEIQLDSKGKMYDEEK